MADFEEISLRLPDGYTAYGRYWPATEPKGAVLYHHGIQSHCGWYERSPAALAGAGYTVLQCDRRGCGRNESERGHAESADQLIDDAACARDELLRRSALDELHVVGVSWGGRLAVASYVTEPQRVRSLSLVTPGLFPRRGVSADESSRIGFAMLYEQTKLFDIPLDGAELFTQVPKWQSFIKQDPLTLRQATAGFYLASRRMDKIIQKLPASPPVPIHLFLAGEEGIIDNDKTADFIAGLDQKDAVTTRYESARHSLEFEPCADQYTRDLLTFIDQLS